MANMLEYYLELDSYYVIFGIMFFLLLLVIILFIMTINTKKKLKKLTRNYTNFMRGKDAESLEDAILRRFEEIDELKEKDEQKQKMLLDIFEKLKGTYQKIGIVKYDAFHEMGGKLSFALTVLDEENNGYVMNSMHGQEGCYTYIKEIIKGQSFITLGEEEKQSLEQAINAKTIVID